MITKQKILILLAIIASGCAVVITIVFGTDIIVLKTGEFITAGSAWSVGGEVFYDKSGEVRSVDEETVAEILQGPPKTLSIFKRRLGYIYRAAATRVGSIFTFHFDLSAKIPPAIFWLLVVMAVSLSIRGRRRLRLLIKRLQRPKVIQNVPITSATPTAGAPEQCGPELSGFPEVEAFFLDLYRRQLGAPPGSPGAITPERHKSNGPDRVYKLKVKHRGEWKSRRMTLGALGEDIRSRSQCFYAIFDTHLVIKIPPVPIKDFTDYIRRIRYESVLVRRLSPRLCIIPNVSVIMDRIKHLNATAAFLSKVSEDKYIQLLEGSASYQECLKIDGAFAFFMDLSRHYFLSFVLAELRDVDAVIREDMAGDAEAIPSDYDLERKYGMPNGESRINLQAVYSQFERELAAHLTETKLQTNPSDKQKREWFLSHLSGDAIFEPGKHRRGNGLLAEISKILKAVAPPTSETVIGYRKIVADHADHLVFNRNRPQLEAMTTNLLDLLVWLGEKCIAIRDLKPDNLLVAGKKDNYPLFLLSARDYSIGLIDLETAVNYDPPGNRPPPQPQLGGTPTYATPSHLLINPLIIEIYGDLSRILHLQDWYAMVGIIYEAVMGHRLFLKTGCHIPNIMQTMQREHGGRARAIQVYRQLNTDFWETAGAEFFSKTREHESRLAQISAEVPQTMAESLIDYLATQAEAVDHSIRDRLQDKVAVPSSKYREALQEAPLQKIEKSRARYVTSDLESNRPIISMLDDLAALKHRSERVSRLTTQLKTSHCMLPLMDLLTLMFGLVAGAMAPDDYDTGIFWPEREEALPELTIDELETRNLGYTLSVELEFE